MSDAFDALVRQREAELTQQFYRWIADGVLKDRWDKETCPIPGILTPRGISWGLKTDADGDPLSVWFSGNVRRFKEELVTSMPNVISLAGYATSAAREQIMAEALKYAAANTPTRKIIRK